jgi:hypothetical protein
VVSALELLSSVGRFRRHLPEAGLSDQAEAGQGGSGQSRRQLSLPSQEEFGVVKGFHFCLASRESLVKADDDGWPGGVNQ